MNRITAEQLLSGDPAVSGDLADLLAAAAPPAPIGEIPGEETAMAGFRSARLHPDRRPERSTVRATVAKVVTAKIATVAIVLLTAGGVAVAASTGVLPSPLRPHPSTSSTADSSPAATGRTSPAPALTAGTSPVAGPTARTSAAPSTPPGPSPVPDPIRSPADSAQFRGLCTAYAAQMAAGHSSVLDTPAFARLVEAAGGKNAVAAFCAALAARPTPPGHSGKTSTHPNGKSTASAAPTTQPSAHRGGHPGGKPSTHPGH